MAGKIAAGTGPFAVRDCALIGLATGKKAVQLQELRDRIIDIDIACIYYHFWGGLLQPRFEEREYSNDFAAWVRHGIHDSILAERLAALDPLDYADLEMLRRRLVDLLEQRMDELEYLAWMRATMPFQFIRSQIVVFNTPLRLQQPADLGRSIGELSTSSVFYHFIDARRRTDSGHDDFSDWLAAFGDAYQALQKQLAGVDPYFGSLSELRAALTAVFREYFAGSPS